MSAFGRRTSSRSRRGRSPQEPPPPRTEREHQRRLERSLPGGVAKFQAQSREECDQQRGTDACGEGVNQEEDGRSGGKAGKGDCVVEERGRSRSREQGYA